MMSRHTVSIMLAGMVLSCESQAPDPGSMPDRPEPTRQPPAKGVGGSGGLASEAPPPQPRYHPPPGFEACKHAEVKAGCNHGWCTLPPSCFVMGSPEDEWHRAKSGEEQVAVTLSNAIEIQQEEMSRKQWEEITGIPAPGPDNCTEPECPVAMVSWWDAVHAANLLSEKQGLEPCYEPLGCTGTLGKDLACTAVAQPEKSVYECEGYRLPTRAEAEYAARAGTTSTFYSGDITPYEDWTKCNRDPALEKIAWYCFNSQDRPHIGGQLEPNGFGLCDIIGNLSEWTNEVDRSSSTPGGVNPRGEVGPRRDRLTFSPQYNAPNDILRTASLLSVPWDGRGNEAGFRLVRTLTPNSPPDGAAGASNN